MTLTMYTETVDVDACKYIRSLSLTEFKSKFCTGGWKQEHGELNYTRVETYFSEVKKYCTMMINNDGESEVTYKFGKNRSDGRQYSEVFSIQRLSKPLRDIMLTEDYVDYDMKNAHPSIFLILAKKFEQPCHYLDEYVSNREAILDKTGLTKKDILVIINSDYTRPHKHVWVNAFVTEMKALKKHLYNNCSYTQTNSKNPISSACTKQTCVIENENLMKAVMKDTEAVLVFDGFLTKIPIDINQLNKNAIPGIEWSVKPWTKTPIPEYNDCPALTYIDTKTSFEEKCFIIEEPLMFNMNGKFIPEKDFKTRSRVFKYETQALDGKIKSLGIYDTWIADASHRSYSSVTSAPFNPLENDPTPDNIYNEAKEFGFEYVTPEVRDTRPIDDLKYIIEHLTATSEEATYILNFIADILQNPRRNPQVLIVFKGHAEGVGKDTINKILRKLLGTGYVASVGDMNAVFGSYNQVLDSKLVLQFNECESKQGHSLWNVIKDQVTADENTIKVKYLIDKIQPNYTRLFISSNNPNPVPGGRRPMICQTRINKIISKDWFKELYSKKLVDKHYIDSLGSHLLDIDLTDADVMNPPMTAVHKNKGESTIMPVHKFYQDICEGKHNTADGIRLLPDDKLGCKPKWLLRAYRTFHESQTSRIEPPAKYKADIVNLNNDYIGSGGIMQNQKPYINGKQVRCTVIDKLALIKSLKNGNRYTEEDDDDDDASF